MKLAVDGLGRVGRLLLRHVVNSPGVALTCVREAGTPSVLAHLIKHDTTHGRAAFDVRALEGALGLGEREVPMLDPASSLLPADVVIDCRKGVTNREAVMPYFEQGAQRVLVAGICEGADVTIAPGINDDLLRQMPVGAVISASSPTTHCLALLLQTLERIFPVQYGLMTAVHSYTNDQQLLDLPHEDLRRARAATMSMVPTESRALSCIDQVMPHWQGRLSGLAVRVPTPNVSIVDLTVWLDKDVEGAQVNEAFAAAAQSRPHLIKVLDEELVSSDLQGESVPCLFDPFLTKVFQGRMVKVFGWYDNEWAYGAQVKAMALALKGQ